MYPEFISAWQIKAGMLTESNIRLYGGCIPALKRTAVDEEFIMLGGGLTLTELGTSLDILEAQLEGKQWHPYNIQRFYGCKNMNFH